MAKQGMKRPERTHTKPRNTQEPVPEIQGKAKAGKEKANPIIEGVGTAGTKVFHKGKTDKPISSAYPVMDTDLARDNIEIDLPKADLQNL